MSRFWALKRSVYAPFEKQNQLGRVIILLCTLDGNRKHRQAGIIPLDGVTGLKTIFHTNSGRSLFDRLGNYQYPFI